MKYLGYNERETMKKLLFIFNPRSGKEQIRNKLLDLLDIFIKAQYEVAIHVTQRQADAVNVIKEQGQGMDLIVVSGGDGTLNEAVTGLMSMERGERPQLGYIPSGSTNDFASSMGISKNMKQAAMDAVTGSDFAIDIGRFGGDKYFSYVAAFGAFTEVSYRTPQETKNLLGHQAYMLEAVKRVASLKSYYMKLKWDDRELEDEFILGMVTNTISIGGFKGLVGLDVALDDGEFEVLLVRRPKTPKDIRNIVSYLVLKEGENECVYQFRAREIKISSSEPVGWSLDGEYGGSPQEVIIENLNKEIVLRRGMAKGRE